MLLRQANIPTGALFGIDDEHSSDEIFRFFGDGIPIWLQELVVALLDSLKQLRVIVGVKGREATQQDVDDDTERPDVARLVIVAFEDFWSDVVRCSNDRMHALNRLFL